VNKSHLVDKFILFNSKHKGHNELQYLHIVVYEEFSNDND